jgi:ElaB/YqjD/DUF883 family membrane-anchored ribosome-binding protein
MSHDDHRRADRILARIDRTRGEMDETLSAIEQRLTPQQLLNQGLDYVRRSGALDFVQNLGGAARQNPLPIALTGIGIFWLMALGRAPAQDAGDGESTVERVSEGISSVKRRADEKLSSLRAAAGATTATVAETSRRQWNRARGGIDHLVQEQPLLLGAIGLAVGAALGASAPRTPQEDRTFGEASRKLTDKARELGGEQLARARDSVDQALNAPH